MTAFEDLKSQWEKQSQSEVPTDGAKLIMEKITSIRKKQKITNIVLSITGLVLVGFFFYIQAYRFPKVMMGLSLMIGTLVVRIAIEVLSIKTIKKMNLSADAFHFRQLVLNYYKNRAKVHFIATPIIIVLYCIGFVLLLPAFKASLSSGFYTYIVVSSIVLLLVLGIFIVKQIQKELSILKELKKV